MIIDPSNAPCGPGSIPGLRLSEGRSQSIGGTSPVPPRLGCRSARSLRPPKCRRGGASSSPRPRAMEPALRRAPNAAGGCPWTHVSRSSHAAPGASGGLRPDARLFGPVERGPPPQRRARDALPGRSPTISQRPQIRRDDPLNLSILLSGGKETNKDSPSSGERRGKSPAPNPRPRRAREMWRTGDGRRPGVDRGPESF